MVVGSKEGFTGACRDNASNLKLEATVRAGAYLQSLMASDSNLDHKVPLRVSNQKAYVWDVQGTSHLEFYDLES